MHKYTNLKEFFVVGDGAWVNKGEGGARVIVDLFYYETKFLFFFLFCFGGGGGGGGAGGMEAGGLE